jgi:hypothetical protein
LQVVSAIVQETFTPERCFWKVAWMRLITCDKVLNFGAPDLYAGLREWFSEGGVPIPAHRILHYNTELVENHKERRISTTIEKSPSMDAKHFDDSEDDDDYNTPHVSDHLDGQGVRFCLDVSCISIRLLSS